ncbi:hypothetical protein KIPB_006473, partial [Kipferlia bialata]
PYPNLSSVFCMCCLAPTFVGLMVLPLLFIIDAVIDPMNISVLCGDQAIVSLAYLQEIVGADKVTVREATGNTGDGSIYGYSVSDAAPSSVSHTYTHSVSGEMAETNQIVEYTSWVPNGEYLSYDIDLSQNVNYLAFDNSTSMAVWAKNGGDSAYSYRVQTWGSSMTEHPEGHLLWVGDDSLSAPWDSVTMRPIYHAYKAQSMTGDGTYSLTYSIDLPLYTFSDDNEIGTGSVSKYDVIAIDTASHEDCAEGDSYAVTARETLGVAFSLCCLLTLGLFVLMCYFLVQAWNSDDWEYDLKQVLNHGFKGQREKKFRRIEEQRRRERNANRERAAGREHEEMERRAMAQAAEADRQHRAKME